ncbi:hypothetical protein SDRG_07988 [Saprolegnia diclina VS20]|uniref:FYVE-type domain-containing protein n=1 Tax=Saprolegnia diclina (strain VS20) TaxID=1156394 RepID=T0Q9T1_SAPDV|nr:hypothetical protein SDRG_07988 [Saprolegnia diclina VS20]EQC34669.1 hypothetical protein SDRG_07988 [Saprolegnia diclina VS20]|eukprot:XP_008612075.1 hypothetical protein SDRG_07988 [Saprolegnia diclina VS20]
MATPRGPYRYELLASDLLDASVCTLVSTKACVVCRQPVGLPERLSSTNCRLCGDAMCLACTFLVPVTGRDDKVSVCSLCFQSHERLQGPHIAEIESMALPAHLVLSGPKVFARPEDLVPPDASAPRDTTCAGCARSFTLLRRRHWCATCGLAYCERCTSNGLALWPDATTSIEIETCTTCAAIAHVDKSYASCKTLQAQIRTLVTSPTFPANTQQLAKDGTLYEALIRDTKRVLPERNLASTVTLVPPGQRSACFDCKSRVRFGLCKRHCAMCGELFCVLCLDTVFAAGATPREHMRTVAQCFECHAKQITGENPWLSTST